MAQGLAQDILAGSIISSWINIRISYYYFIIIIVTTGISNLTVTLSSLSSLQIFHLSPRQYWATSFSLGHPCPVTLIFKVLLIRHCLSHCTTHTLVTIIPPLTSLVLGQTIYHTSGRVTLLKTTLMGSLHSGIKVKFLNTNSLTGGPFTPAPVWYRGLVSCYYPLAHCILVPPVCSMLLGLIKQLLVSRPLDMLFLLSGKLFPPYSLG